jgi:integrase
MRKSRRGAGEGSIYRRKDGRWASSLTIGSDENGRRRRKTVYGVTRREVAEKLLELQKDAQAGAVLDASRIVVGDYLAQWLRDSVQPVLSHSTHLVYSTIVRNHVRERIGGVRLQRLSPAHIQALYAEMERNKASGRLQQITHHMLRKAFRQAVKWGLIPRSPVDVVERPKAKKREVAYLDAEQVGKLLSEARGHRLEALFVLAVATGCRQGELLGLQWGDIDWRAGAITVRRQLREHGGKLEDRDRFELAPLKSDSKPRRVDLPTTAIESLRRHRSRLGAVPHPQTLVFTNTQGGPIRKCNLIRREFKPLLRSAQLPDIRFHDLRHTAATLALSLGIHPKVVQERLGHSQISTTHDTYSHVVPTLQREAAERIDGALGS